MFTMHTNAELPLTSNLLDVKVSNKARDAVMMGPEATTTPLAVFTLVGFGVSNKAGDIMECLLHDDGGLMERLL